MPKHSAVEQRFQARMAQLVAILANEVEPEDANKYGPIKKAIEMLWEAVSESEDLRSADFARQLARAAGLEHPSPQLLNDVGAALTLYLTATVVEKETLIKIKRPATYRTEMRAVARAAETARDPTENLSDALGRLSPDHAEALREATGGAHFDAIASFSAPLDRLAMIADQTAAIPELIDGGGRPRYFALDMLIHGLADVFECHTGQDAKVNPNEAKPPGEKFSGPFLAFVEAVLPTAKALAGASGEPLRLPASKDALGKFVHRVTIARGPHSKPQVA